MRSSRPPIPKTWLQALPALKFEGRKRWHDADAFIADIVAKRLVRYLERAGYVVMKRPPLEGHSSVTRGFKG
jgi:hypothetical protein